MKVPKSHVPVDEVIPWLASIGVPALVLVVAMSATGFAGAAALTTALAGLGPGGMVGGVVVLLAGGGVSHLLADKGFDYVFTAVIKQLVKQGESRESIMAKIDKYPISRDLRLRLLDETDSAFARLDPHAGDL